jgi:hypothetical protein
MDSPDDVAARVVHDTPMRTTSLTVSCPTPLRGFALIALLVALPAGCGKPNAANILLRKENQELRTKVADLERRRQGDLAQLRARENGGNTLATLPQERLEKLFTVHGLQFGRLSGASDFDPNSPGEDGLKIHVVPTDGSGQPLKAAGSFVLEAFDLARGDDARIGRWEFPLEEAAKNWVGQALLYGYVLQAPWQQRPQNPELTLRVTFTDALTGRTFTQQKVIRVTVPTTPSTAPARNAVGS